MWAILFLLLPLAGIAYVGWHIWTLLPLHWGWKAMVVLLGAVCFGMLFLNFKGKLDTFPLGISRMVYEIGTSSIFVMLYLVMLFLVLDLGRLCHLVPRTVLYGNWWTAVGILAFVIAIFFGGNYHYKNKVRVPIEVKTDKPLARTYKVVMASDLHLGYHNPRKELARWVDMMNAEKPDFILIAGDLIDGSIRPLKEERMDEEFHRLTAPVYACLGNHEHFGGDANARQFYKDAGIHLLIDEAAVIDSAIVVIGRDDRSSRHRKSVEDLMKSATSHISHLSPLTSHLYTIVLDHQPYDLDKAEAAGVDFQLSGHTHRGQVWPISWITDAIYECSWGSHQRGNTHFYISSGLGLWGGKFRIGTQSEYVVATIH
jgi:predicted MPP superfamily phosphohydrolase